VNLRWCLSVIPATVLVVACRTHGEVGTLHAHWASLDTTLGTGTVAVPATAAWCERRGRLTLSGVSGDTGVGVLVRTVSLAPGRFTVSDTTAQPSPGAAIALRFAKGAGVFALSSDSGVAAITSVQDGRVTGRFVAWLSRPEERPVLLIGDFSGVPAAQDQVRCESPEPPPAPSPPPADSGVTLSP
jgi:hypothetical protein